MAGRRAVLLVAMSLIMQSLMLSPAWSGSATPPLLHVQSTSSQWALVHLAVPTSVDVVHARFLGRGSFIVWWLTSATANGSVDPQLQVGGAWVRRIQGAADTSPTAVIFGKDVLPAGNYRLYVGSDARADVTVPLTRGRSLTPRLARGTSAGMRVATQPPLPGGFAASQMAESAAVPAGSLVLATAVMKAQPGATVDQITACAGPTGMGCLQPISTWGYTASVSTPYSLAYTVEYPPGRLPAGVLQAQQKVTAAPLVTSTYGALVWLRAPLG
jgi:hypothetical protein